MIEVWHNPRCSKSRQALALLQEHGQQPVIRRHLDDPPTLAELKAVQRKLGLPAIDMIRRGETLFRELGLSTEDPDERLLEMMATHPRLIERPVVIAGDRAVIGRPPERVLQLL